MLPEPSNFSPEPSFPAPVTEAIGLLEPLTGIEKTCTVVLVASSVTYTRCGALGGFVGGGLPGGALVLLPELQPASRPKAAMAMRTMRTRTIAFSFNVVSRNA